MGKIVAMVGQKGGAAKSTNTIAIAVETHRRGISTLIVDADIEEQRSALTWADVADEKGVDVPRVVGMGNALRTQLPAEAEKYDLTLIDCPGRNGRRVAHALALADLAILGVSPSPIEIWAMQGSVDQVRDVQAVRGDAPEAVILLNRRDKRTVLGRQAREALESLEIPVMRTELSFLYGYQYAPGAGKGPTTYEPTSEAADEVRALVDELERLLRLPRRKAALELVRNPPRKAAPHAK